MCMVFMLSKYIYAVQPYQVGSRERKSLALIIPARITKECSINPSTIFSIQVDPSKKIITLQMITPQHDDVTPAGQRLRPTIQQVSGEHQ